MPTHEPPNHDPHDPNSPDYNPGADSPGYEVTDVNVKGIVVFLASLFAFVGVFFIFCFGMARSSTLPFSRATGRPTNGT